MTAPSLLSLTDLEPHTEICAGPVTAGGHHTRAASVLNDRPACGSETSTEQTPLEMTLDKKSTANWMELRSLRHDAESAESNMYPSGRKTAQVQEKLNNATVQHAWTTFATKAQTGSQHKRTTGPAKDRHQPRQTQYLGTQHSDFKNARRDAVVTLGTCKCAHPWRHALQTCLLPL